MKINGVIKLPTPFEKLKEQEISAEVKLYKAIILQAIIDASSDSDNREARKLELEAKRWIFGYSDSFKTVCSNAKLDVGTVRKSAREAIKISNAQHKKHLPPLRKIDQAINDEQNIAIYLRAASKSKEINKS